MEELDEDEMPSVEVNDTMEVDIQTTEEELYVVRNGVSDFHRFWLPEKSIPNCAQGMLKDPNRHPDTGMCKKYTHCVYCASIKTKIEDAADGYTDETAAAILLLMHEEGAWKTPDTTSIFAFICSIHESLKGTPRSQKYFSHFGAMRVDCKRATDQAKRGRLNSFYPLMKMT